MYTELNVTLPGADLINDLLDGANVPRALFWFQVMFGMILLCSFLIYFGTKSLEIKAIFTWLFIMLGAALKGYGWWILIPWTIEALAFVVAKRKMGW